VFPFVSLADIKNELFRLYKVEKTALRNNFDFKLCCMHSSVGSRFPATSSRTSSANFEGVKVWSMCMIPSMHIDDTTWRYSEL